MREGTLHRTRQRSFTPASFLEEDFTVDFPDELDTSFFARVRAEQQGRDGVGWDGKRRGCWQPQQPPQLSLSSFAQEGVLPEELSTYPDEVFESPSEAALGVPETKAVQAQPALTGGALDRSELERSHLLL